MATGAGARAPATRARYTVRVRSHRERAPFGLRARRIRALVLVALVLSAAPGCAPAAAPAPVRFVRVELPGGAVPEVMAAAGDELLVGVRHAEHGPGVVRLAADGTVTEAVVEPATGYGRTASWHSLAFDGRQVAGVGGDRGGIHGNVRWSVWTGSATAVHEQPQAFSTFGGWGAGGLVDAVLTPAGPVVVGSWQSADAGLDVAVWTAADGTWARHGSTGTPLASTRGVQGFPVDAAASGQGVVVVGWQVGAGSVGPVPVVWESASAEGPWTRTALPGAGSAAAAVAVGCAGGTCAVSGRVDGSLALWRRADGGWTRVGGLPPVPVGTHDRLPAPLDPAGRLTQVVSGGGRIEVLTVDGSSSAVHPVEGPTGAAVSTAEAGDRVYLLAGPDEDALQLWRADAAAFG